MISQYHCCCWDKDILWIVIEQRIEKEEVRYVPLKIVYKQKDADRIYGQYKSGMFKGFMKEVVKFQVLLGIFRIILQRK